MSVNQIDEEVKSQLIKLKSEDSRARFWASDELVKITYQASEEVKLQAIKEMILSFEVEDLPTNDRIVWALGNLGGIALAELKKFIESKTGKIRKLSIHSVGRYISHPKIRLDTLKDLLQHEEKEVRTMASSSLNNFAQNIGSAKEYQPDIITKEQEEIKSELIFILEKNMKSEELKIEQFTEQALNWLKKKKGNKEVDLI